MFDDICKFDYRKLAYPEAMPLELWSEVWRVYSGLLHVSSPSGVVQAAKAKRKATGINRYPDPRYRRVVACVPGHVDILAMRECEREYSRRLLAA